tara:strand:- start:600 stop:836 length:237 start_codon:yes stop_codon:yes gene_type:complete
MNQLTKIRPCIRSELYKSLLKRYESDIQSAKTTLFIYFDKPVAIGEHPQHLEEMDKLLGNISEANDKIEALHFHFNNH